jgi:predicted Kef-type K+ transport protein
MIESAWIAFAFVMGLVARGVGLPPLVGYLGAGFALAAFGGHIGVGPRDSVALDHIAHLGVLLLLFTVGLKLKISNLVRREVIGGGLLHFAISSLIFLPAILYLLE